MDSIRKKHSIRYAQVRRASVHTVPTANKKRPHSFRMRSKKRKDLSFTHCVQLRFLLVEKERFSHKVARDFVCTVATKAFAFPRSMSLGRQKSSCCHSKNLPSSATGGGRVFSLSHRYAVLDFESPFSAIKKPPYWVVFGGEGEIFAQSRSRLCLHCCN